MLWQLINNFHLRVLAGLWSTAEIMNNNNNNKDNEIQWSKLPVGTYTNFLSIN